MNIKQTLITSLSEIRLNTDTKQKAKKTNKRLVLRTMKVNICIESQYLILRQYFVGYSDGKYLISIKAH